MSALAKKQYWAVWVKDDDGQWIHHMSCDTRADAEIEAHWCKRQGEQTRIEKQEW